MRDIQYYRPDNFTLDDNTVLISGQCARVKALYLADQLRKAAAARCKAVVIDFGRTGSFSGILNSAGFHLQRSFVVGKDNYAPIDTSVRDAVLNLRTHAHRLGYEHSSYAQMTAFLNFLINLDSGNCHNIRQLLKKYSNQEKLEKELLLIVRNKTMTVQQAEENIQTYLEYAASGVTADILLSELDFILRPDTEANAFSLSDLRQGEAAVLYASENNSTDLNDYMARLWTIDLIHMAESEPLFIAINAGHYPQIDRMYELAETVSHNPHVSIFYSSYDIFSGVSADRAKAFSKLFCYDIYGRHTGDSAMAISSMFSEHWLTQLNYADAHNRRIMGENLIDKILGTDHTMTISTSLIKESIIPAYSIAGLSDHEFIRFNTITNEVRSASV